MEDLKSAKAPPIARTVFINIKILNSCSTILFILKLSVNDEVVKFRSDEPIEIVIGPVASSEVRYLILSYSLFKKFFY